MNKSRGFLFRLGVILTLTVTMACTIVLYIWFQLDAAQVQAIEHILRHHLYALLMLGVFIAGVIGFGLEAVYIRYVSPLDRISRDITLTFSSNPGHRIDVSGGQEINGLVSVLNQCAQTYEDQTAAVTEQIISARQETEKERNLLAAIMDELPYAVIICNRNGRILLFNSLAKKMFTSQNAPGRVEHFIGLGRSVFHFFNKERIAHAIDEMEERLNNRRKSMASYFITPLYNDLLLSVESMPVLDHNNRMTGFILNIQDISKQVETYETIDQQLLSFRQAMSRSLEDTRAVVSDLLESCRIDTALYQLSHQKVIDTLSQLAQKYEETSVSILDHNLAKLPLTRIPMSIFLFGIQKKAGREDNIRVNISNDAGNSRIIADSYSLTAAFCFILRKISQITGQKEFDMSVNSFNGKITFDITWPDIPASQIQVENLLTRKIRTLPSLGYVLKQNQSAFKIISKNRQTCSRVRLFARAELKSIPIKRKRGAVLAGSRPEFYDFDLFAVDNTKTNILNQNLKDIIYCVFDTETTGLDPDGGDEILSIAAVRIVNNQIIRNDFFEELVDPKRDIPLDSYKIHGINYDMVEGKPDIETILPLFKIYSYDTVLVGHNIAFDMKMLKVKEKAAKTVFTNPVLDTLLLSAVLHPLDEQHDMESIAKRLGVNIVGRHTALGDAIATAEIFLKLIPLLNSNGIFTLKNAVEASQKTFYARLKY